MNLLVSIIMPLYNREHQVTETIDSVIKQSYSKWELIIVDDGSTDNSFSIVNSLCKADSRIKLSKRERKPNGPSTCRNIGLELAQGDYVIFLDSDDILKTNCLKSRIETLVQKPCNDFFVFNALMFHDKPNDSNLIFNKYPKGNETYLDMFLNINIPWQTTAVLWNISFIKKIGGWNEKLLTKTDPELHIRALLNNPSFEVLKNSMPDYFYRINNLDSDKKDYFVERTVKYWRPFFEIVFSWISRKDSAKIEMLRIGILRVVKFNFFKYSNAFPADYETFVLWTKNNGLINLYEFLILKFAHKLKCNNFFLVRKLRIIGLLYRLIPIPKKRV